MGKKEFENDPMMKKLHRIREQHFKETKNLSTKELIAYYERKAAKIRPKQKVTA